MCNKHVHSTVTHSSRFHCLIGVINKPTTVELRYDTIRDAILTCARKDNMSQLNLSHGNDNLKV